MTSCIRKCVSSEDGQNANSVVVVVGADHFEGIKGVIKTCLVWWKQKCGNCWNVKTCPL